jgi:amino acid transporter
VRQGILSLPAALKTIGLIPGIIAILGFGILTTYSGYILVQFFRRYPMVTNLVDCAQVLDKRFGAFFGAAFILNLVLICASANITMSVALNTLSNHALCTVAFMAFPHIVCWMLCLPRKLTFAAALSWVCTISIVAAVLIVMIALGVAGPRAPPGFEVSITLVGKPTFVETVNALLNIAFAFAGNQSFISVMAEMRDASKDFPPALFMQKSFEVIIYIIVACVIYGLAGDAVTSPALGSAAAIPAKIAYGVLIPSVLGTGLIIGITAIKVRISHVKERPTTTNLFPVHVRRNHAPLQAARNQRPQRLHLVPMDRDRYAILAGLLHRLQRDPNFQLHPEHHCGHLHQLVHLRINIGAIFAFELGAEAQHKAEVGARMPQLCDSLHDCFLDGGRAVHVA